MFPILINAGSGIVRSELQQWMERNGVDTRMVWTGNVTRQPMLRGREFRVPPGGLPNADAVMEQGLILPNSHSLSDEDCHYIGECLAGFLAERGLT
jgi:CDP-6-deoxy-D-xylo-4-hexulose-3-dehydrase